MILLFICAAFEASVTAAAASRPCTRAAPTEGQLDLGIGEHSVVPRVNDDVWIAWIVRVGNSNLVEEDRYEARLDGHQ